MNIPAHINQRILVWGAILSALIFLAGCQSTMVNSTDLNLPEKSRMVKTLGDGHDLVYAVKTPIVSNYLEIKKFGLYYGTSSDVTLKHGLSYTLDADEHHVLLDHELEWALKKGGFESIDQFNHAYGSSAPIVPGSKYAALPFELGQDLYRLARRVKDMTNDERNPYLIPPGGHMM
ncbi:MAG: hypothetical protein D3926_25020 [Desulfobacteraceae bacterium]|nr:MAG: hypothetical protein D3926_25020 [Desulfobacteraceae bacterium]